MGVPGTYFPSVKSFWDWLSPDKAVHLVVFGVQSILLLHAFREQYFQKKKRLIYQSSILLISILFALSTEVLQKYLFVGRDGNVWDFIADVVGVFIGFLAYYLLNYKKMKAKNRIQ